MGTLALDFSKMNALELKATIYSYIEKLQDRETLQDWAEVIYDETHSSTLSSEQEAELEIGIQQSYDEALLVSNDDVKKMTSKWLQK